MYLYIKYLFSWPIQTNLHFTNFEIWVQTLQPYPLLAAVESPVTPSLTFGLIFCAHQNACKKNQYKIQGKQHKLLKRTNNLRVISSVMFRHLS